MRYADWSQTPLSGEEIGWACSLAFFLPRKEEGDRNAVVSEANGSVLVEGCETKEPRTARPSSLVELSAHGQADQVGLSWVCFGDRFK